MREQKAGQTVRSAPERWNHCWNYYDGITNEVKNFIINKIDACPPMKRSESLATKHQRKILWTDPLGLIHMFTTGSYMITRLQYIKIESQSRSNRNSGHHRLTLPDFGNSKIFESYRVVTKMKWWPWSFIGRDLRNSLFMWCISKIIYIIKSWRSLALAIMTIILIFAILREWFFGDLRQLYRPRSQFK